MYILIEARRKAQRKQFTSRDVEVWAAKCLVIKTNRQSVHTLLIAHFGPEREKLPHS